VGVVPIPHREKGNGTVKSALRLAVRGSQVPGADFEGADAEIAIRTSRSESVPFPKAVIPSPSRLRPRIALTRPGDARAKAGGAIPLVEPELSPESQPTARNASSIILIHRTSIIVPTLIVISAASARPAIRSKSAGHRRVRTGLRQINVKRNRDASKNWQRLRSMPLRSPPGSHLHATPTIIY
jgi:hypothetical protein